MAPTGFQGRDDGAWAGPNEPPEADAQIINIVESRSYNSRLTKL